MTLVELMVALTIALIILAAMAQLFATSRATYTVEEGMSRLQEGGRFTFDMLAHDIRQAGHFGCVSLPPNPTKVGNTVSAIAPATTYDARARAGIQGYRYKGSGSANLLTDWTPPLIADGYFVSGSEPFAPLPYSDVLVIRYATSPGIQLVNAAPSNGAIQIPKDYENIYNIGDVLMVASCSNADVFVLTGKATAGNDTTLTHDTSRNTSAQLVNTYGTGDELMQFGTNIYYVANTNRNDRNGRPIPALFRKVLNGTNLQAQELIEGVEAIQFYYGVLAAAGSKGNSVPSRYVPADQVTDWSTVTSVRLGAVVSTTENVSQDSENVVNLDVVGLASDVLDDYDPPDDRRHRRVFSTVVLKRQPPR